MGNTLSHYNAVHFNIYCSVLNTDNMSIVGLTIDYGPYGFMDRYDPGHICNGSGLSAETCSFKQWFVQFGNIVEWFNRPCCSL